MPQIVGIRPPAEPRRVVLLPAAPAPAVLSGRVLDEAGRPVPGARVTTGNPDFVQRTPAARNPCFPPWRTEATADAEGRFELDRPEGEEVELWAMAAGFLRESRRLSREAAGHGIDVVLHPGAAVYGKVLSPDGAPVAGARVYAAQSGPTPQTVTDAQGRYRLAAVEPGWRDLWADHPEHGEARRRLQLAPGGHRLDLTLDGQRERALAGRVTGPDGEPLAGVRVQAADGVAFSRDDGSFRIVLARGSLLRYEERETLRLTREGFADRSQAFRPAAMPIEGLEIAMERGHRLSGRLVGVADDLLSSVQVVARRGDSEARGKVDPEGGYRIDGLASGAWTVTASLSSRTVRKTVEVDRGETVLDLELPAVVKVRGRLLDVDGQPLAAQIHFERPEPGSDSVLSREDGSFSLELTPGDYEVFLYGRLCGPGVLRRRVTVRDEEEADLSLRLEPGVLLWGRILGLPPGLDASRKAVVAVTQGTDSAEAAVAPDGTYRCAGLEPGAAKVQASFVSDDAEGSAESRVTLGPRASETVLDLDVSQGELTLSGHLTSGDEPFSARVVLLGEGRAAYGSDVLRDDDRTDFQFRGLPPGRYVLRIEDFDRDRAIERPIDLTSDRSVTIDLLHP